MVSAVGRTRLVVKAVLAGRGRSRRMTPFYVAGLCLVVAQILGIYALVTRKADFTFALIMLLLVVVALASGAEGVYRQLH